MSLEEKMTVRNKQFNALITRCYDDYCFYNRMEMGARQRFVDEMSEAVGNELVIPYLPVYLTTRCTLNCEKCNNLMPYFKTDRPEFDLETIKDSLKRILSVVKEMIFCELVGGEPFLHSRFEDVLDFVADQPKIRQIVVVTNATRIPSDPVIEKLAKSNAIVRISDYGMFDRMTQFVSKLDKAGVNIRIQQDMKWNDPGGVTARGRARQMLKQQYSRCEFSMKCKYLCQDKLFTCARAASLYLLGVYASGQDMIQVDERLTADALREFYLRDEADVCDYCDLWSADGGKQIESARQLQREDWQRSNYTVISNYELERLKKNNKKYEEMMQSLGSDTSTENLVQ